MAPIDPAIKQNYIDLHESTGESYESIAKRATAQDDKDLASWLRSQAKGEASTTEQEQRSEPPQGRLPAKQETAAAADAEAAKEAEANEAAAKTGEAAAKK